MVADALFWFTGFMVLVILLLIVANRRLFMRRPAAVAILRPSGDLQSASANDAVRRMRDVVGLARRLAAGGGVTTRCMSDWATYRCWSLTLRIPTGSDKVQADRGMEVTAFWDGRDGLLSFDIEPQGRIHECKVARGVDPIAPAEEYLTKLLRRPDEADPKSIAGDAIATIENVSAFAERLARRNVVIARLDCRSTAPGQWYLDLYNGERTDEKHPSDFVVRAAWNGASRMLVHCSIGELVSE
jgi:hypothetical protein